MNRGTTEVKGRFHGVWFLKRSTDSSWDALTLDGVDGVFTGLFLPASVAVPDSYQYTPAASPTDKVTIEIANGVIEGGREPRIALRFADSASQEVVDSIIYDFLRSGKIDFQTAAVSTLLNRSDPEAITRLQQIWPSIPDARRRAELVSGIRNSFRNTSPYGVRQLLTLINEPPIDADLRNAAIRALSSIHTKETLLFLATLLHSDDDQEQMQAIIGISSFANGSPRRHRAMSRRWSICSSSIPARTAPPRLSMRSRSDQLKANGSQSWSRSGRAGGTGIGHPYCSCSSSKSLVATNHQLTLSPIARIPTSVIYFDWRPRSPSRRSPC